MDRLVAQYAAKMIQAGLAGDTHGLRPLVGGLDDELVWSRQGPEVKILGEVFAGLNINSLVFLRPAEPYGTIIRFLATRAQDTIQPKDCETRTFLHDLPVIDAFTSDAIVKVLKRRKAVIICAGRGDDGPAIAAHGTVSPEQGYVAVSSVCFACFVKFFVDYLQALRQGSVTPDDHDAFETVVASMAPAATRTPRLMTAPFDTQAAVYRALAQAGRQTVALGLVDSYFGNVSFRWRDTLYISQTGSSLDTLEGCVDPVPLDGSTSAGISASSELSAHLEIIKRCGCRAILHGHPKFAVIMSMDCTPEEKAACEFVDQCHIQCPRPRFIEDVPIVPGEVGTGPTGLCRTLPPALENRRGAIVYGHGVFTVGRQDFNEALSGMSAVEYMCQEKYFEAVKALRG